MPEWEMGHGASGNATGDGTGTMVNAGAAAHAAQRRQHPMTEFLLKLSRVKTILAGDCKYRFRSLT